MSMLITPPRGIKMDRYHLLDFGGRLTPPMGGPVQTLHRLGSRFAIDFTLPTVRRESHGRTFAADLINVKLFGARMAIPQDNLNTLAEGSPVVDTAGQTGIHLYLRGFTPDYVAHYGQFFSLVQGGRRYVHMIASNAIANVGGYMSLFILPMLRVIPDDGAVVEFDQPYIEGSLSGNEVSWQQLTAPFTDFGTITVTEDE